MVLEVPGFWGCFSVVIKPITVFLKSPLSFASPQDLCSLFLLALRSKVPSGGGSASMREGSCWLGQKRVMCIKLIFINKNPCI